MWSFFLHDLITAHEEELDPVAASSSQFVTITLTDTAADMMLLLSCLYPASHQSDRKQGSALDAASFLPLLGLADKYHCPHIIDRCAAFAIDHIIPRLTAPACACAAAAAEYLRLPSASSSPSAASAAGVLEWVVRCLELAVRLDLDELVDCTAALLGRRFFDWGLQDPAHGELMVHVTRALPAEKFVQLVLQAIPAPSVTAASTAGGSGSGKAAGGSGTGAARGDAVRNGAPGGGGAGPRIVPVMVAAAGPAAVALQNQPQQQAPVAAPPQPQPLIAWLPQPQPMDPEPNGNGPWFPPGGNGPAIVPFGPAAAGHGGGPVPFGAPAANGAAAGLVNQPEPLLGHGHHGPW